MKTKQCPECKENSYSATDYGEWICPYCSADLSERKSKPAGGNNNEIKSKMRYK